MHKFRTGPWAKANQTAADHYKFLMSSTPTQRSFVHELCNQKLGNAPSPMWGVAIPPELHPQADAATLKYVRHASKHSSHEFGRLISTHKKASGFISSLGSLIGDGAKAVGRYGVKVGKFVAKHGDAIRKGASIVHDLVGTGAQIAAISGAMDPDAAMQLDAISAAVNQHIQGDHYRTKKGDKKGAGVRWRVPLTSTLRPRRLMV